MNKGQGSQIFFEGIHYFGVAVSLQKKFHQLNFTKNLNLFQNVIGSKIGQKKGFRQLLPNIFWRSFPSKGRADRGVTQESRSTFFSAKRPVVAQTVSVLFAGPGFPSSMIGVSGE